jgi:hypothetical protein
VDEPGLVVAKEPKGDINRQRLLSPRRGLDILYLLLAREGLVRRVWPA